jgi:hypothetical protein
MRTLRTTKKITIITKTLLVTPLPDPANGVPTSSLNLLQ